MKFLIEGENVIKKFSQSRLVHFKFYILAIIIFSIPVLQNIFKIKIPAPEIYTIIVPVAIGLMLILIIEIKVRMGSYYITNYRVISIRGFLRKTIDSCTYDKIVNVKVMQTLQQRILGIGNIDITTFQRTEILFDSIGNPTKIERLIYSAMEKQAGQQPGAEKKPPSPLTDRQTAQPPSRKI